MMDTLTHLAMGISLAGLAHLSPEVASDPNTMQAVAITTIIGSQLPDIDIYYRFVSDAKYVKNHRGWTHSLPMLIIWPILLTLGVQWFFPGVSAGLLGLWATMAVWIHMFIDVFNPYGSQILRPMSKKWVTLSTINIFDPYIFAAHIVGFILWWKTSIPPGHIFGWMYGLTVIYIAARSYVHCRKQKLFKKLAPYGNTCNKETIIPTFDGYRWKTVQELDGEVKHGVMSNMNWTEEIAIHPKSHQHQAVVASLETEAVQALRDVSSYAYPLLQKHGKAIEVCWVDARFHYQGHFPFMAIVLLSSSNQVLDSFVGWMSLKKKAKKIKKALDRVGESVWRK